MYYFIPTQRLYNFRYQCVSRMHVFWYISLSLEKFAYKKVYGNSAISLDATFIANWTGNFWQVCKFAYCIEFFFTLNTRRRVLEILQIIRGLSSKFLRYLSDIHRKTLRNNSDEWVILRKFCIQWYIQMIILVYVMKWLRSIIFLDFIRKRIFTSQLSN